MKGKVTRLLEVSYETSFVRNSVVDEKTAYRIVAECDDEFNYLDGIKAYDTCGNDITSELVVSGDVDLAIPGEYVVKYSVVDLLGRTAECTVIYTVR